MSTKIIVKPKHQKVKKKKLGLKKFKKLKFSFLLIFFITIVFSIICSKYTAYKCKDLDYAIKNYTTTGLFNKYKLYSLENYEIKFSDGNFAIVDVKGIENKSPYKVITYKLHIQKNNKGTWKVKEYYPRSYCFLFSELQSLHIPLFKLTQLSNNVNPVFAFTYSWTCCIGQSISTCLWHISHSIKCL